MEPDLLARKAPFKHEPLELGGNSIRLITLQPDNNDYNWITCQIQQYAIHRRPGYIALSYMWGSEEGQFPILLNDQVFNVRRNLYDCLIQLRKQHRDPITLWIDALCIDQTDIPERNHVVQLMDQVYERSDQVYVWLGIGDESSDQAMLFLMQVARFMVPYEYPVDIFLESFMFPRTHYHNWVAVVRLFKRDYWTRLWIIQETLLAPSLELFCGEHRILWKHVEQVVVLVRRSFEHYDKRYPEKSIIHAAILDTLAVRMIELRSDTSWFGGRRSTYPSLQTLVENFKDSQCFDSRDELFGLLSIAGDFFNKRIDYIDYNLRPTEVFIKFLTHYLCVSNDPYDDETLYNIRRLSDALCLDVGHIIRHRNSSLQMQTYYNDLALDTDDLHLALPCHTVLDLIETEAEAEASSPSLVPSCVLRSYFGSMMSGTHSTPVSPTPYAHSLTLPDSPEELSKLRRLARSQASQVCDAFPHPTPNHNALGVNATLSTFKYFTKPMDKSSNTFRPTFGLTCGCSQPGDFVAKTKDSDLAFVSRQVGDAIYDVIGTALVHEDSGTMYRVKSSVRRWWESHTPTSSASTQTSYFANTREDLKSADTSPSTPTMMLRFNPLMLLLLVNAPNWRKDRIVTSLKRIRRQPTTFTAIQPRGEDDPVLKEFGTKLYTGSTHLDRAANKIRDRTAMKLEEIKELAHQYGEWDSD